MKCSLAVVRISTAEKPSVHQFENKKIVVGLAERDGQLHMEIMDHVTLAAMRVKVAERLRA